MVGNAEKAIWWDGDAGGRIQGGRPLRGYEGRTSRRFKGGLDSYYAVWKWMDEVRWSSMEPNPPMVNVLK